MPSKFVAESYVGDKIERVRGQMLDKLAETKEIVEQAKQLISAASEAGPASGVDGAIDFGVAAKEIIARMGAVVNTHDEKLGILAEAGIRRVVAEVGPISDVVRCIANQSGQGQPWVDRSLSTIIDLLQEPRWCHAACMARSSRH